MKTVKAVIYCRVSTEDQVTANQAEVLRCWSSQLRLGMYATDPQPLQVTRVYEESASAWKDGHQRELAQLLQDAARGQFQVVLVWALDRLTRQGILTQFEIMHKLAKFGVLVYSYQELWTLTPTKSEYDLLLAVAAYIAQSSSKRNSERTRAGIERKRLEGWKPGRPPGSCDKKQRKRRRVL